MKKWAVFMCPYTLEISRVQDWNECFYNRDTTKDYLNLGQCLTVVASGNYHVIVEAETEDEAKLKGLHEAATKRINDLKDSVERERKLAVTYKEHRDTYLADLTETDKTFKQIISEGELTIFSTGKRILFERYVAGEKAAGEIDPRNKLPLIMRTIQETMADFVDDCY